MPKGKPIPTVTRLGRKIVELGLPVYAVCGEASVHNRVMTEYLAGRRVIAPHHLENLCRVLECEPDDLIEPGVVNLTNEVGLPIDKSVRSVKDLDMSHLQPYTPPTPSELPKPPRHRPGVAPDRLIRKVG